MVCQITLEAQQFSVGYDGNTALSIDQMSLTGNCIALVGHNGAGKSTFMKALLQILPASTGTLSARNSMTQEILIPERHMAFCPETGSVFSDITVEEYVKLWCRLKMPHANYYREEGAALLEALELTPLLNKKGRELSKGQKQRVQTAVGFCTQPFFFLFDEPFDGLDVQKTHELMQLIREHCPQITFLISSHRMGIIDRLADQVVVLQEGMIKACGPIPKVSSTLCEHMYRIEEATAPEDLYQKLEIAFPTSYIYRIGQDIHFASSTVSEQELSSTIIEAQGDGVLIANTMPTLTDAMSLHLKALKTSS